MQNHLTKTLFSCRAVSRLSPAPSHARLVTQCHTSFILKDQDFLSAQQEADGLFTTQPQVQLAIRTADCVPVFMADHNHHGIAHAGWRGAKDGIVQNLLRCFTDPQHVLVHMGPAICGRCFEVGPDVYEDWLAREPEVIGPTLGPSPNGGDRRMLDLRLYLKYMLLGLGVPEAHISICPICTYESPDLPSFRRDKTTARLWHILGPATHF